MDEQTNKTFEDRHKRETLFHDFDKQKQIVGTLIEIQEGDFGEQYLLKTDQGETILVGTYGVLKSKIRKDDIGHLIKIVYKGHITSEKTKRKYKDFDVWVI